MKFKTKVQQFDFNYPYQLKPKMKNLKELIKNYEFEVFKGDLILMATDGLFDNVFKDDVLEIINKIYFKSL